jgi:hypothetical protein
MGYIEVSLNPIVHAPVAVTQIDLELVEDPEVGGLFGSKPGDLSFLGEDPTLQLVDLLAPVLPRIPTLEHVFDCIGRVRQNPYPCPWNTEDFGTTSEANRGHRYHSLWMLELWRSVRSVWSVVAVVHGIWSLIFLAVTGWFLGASVLSSEPLGALLAIALPVGTIATLWWDRKRRANTTLARRLFANPDIQFVLARKINEGRFPSENWATLARGPAIVAFARPLARQIPPLRRIAASRLLRDRRHLAAAAGLDDSWIAAILVMPGRFPATSVVVDGKLLHVSDLEGTVDTLKNGVHAPDTVRAKFLSVIDD